MARHGSTFNAIYEGPGARFAVVDDGDSDSYLATPGLRLQRVPWFLDLRWIAPAFVASTAMVLLSLLAWPVAALWRYRRKRRWSEDRGDRGNFLAVVLVDAAVIGACGAHRAGDGNGIWSPRILKVTGDSDWSSSVFKRKPAPDLIGGGDRLASRKRVKSRS